MNALRAAKTELILFWWSFSFFFLPRRGQSHFRKQEAASQIFPVSLFLSRASSPLSPCSANLCDAKESESPPRQPACTEICSENPSASLRGRLNPGKQYQMSASKKGSGNAASSNGNGAPPAGARLSRQLPSDLKPLLSMTNTLSVEHPSACGEDGSSSGADGLRRWFDRQNRGDDDEGSLAATTSTSAVFSLGPCLSELKACFLLAWPLVCQNVLYLSNGLVLIVVVGHSAGGEKQLAAAVLGTSLFNVTGLSIAIGLSTALETLCAQAYGARAYLLLGGLLQRALAVQLAVLAFVGAFWYLGLDAALVHLFGQEKDLAFAAARFVRQCYPGLVMTAASECVRRYLVAQGVVSVPAAAAAVSAAVSAATAVVLVPRWGLSGAAAAVNFSSAGSLAALAGGAAWSNARNRRYSAFEVAAAADAADGNDAAGRRNDDAEEAGGGSSKGQGSSPSSSSSSSSYHVTWGGWSLSNALSGWGPYIRVAAPSAAQVCIE